MNLLFKKYDYGFYGECLRRTKAGKYIALLNSIFWYLVMECLLFGIEIPLHNTCVLIQEFKRHVLLTDRPYAFGH